MRSSSAASVVLYQKLVGEGLLRFHHFFVLYFFTMHFSFAKHLMLAFFQAIHELFSCHSLRGVMWSFNKYCHEESLYNILCSRKARKF